MADRNLLAEIAVLQRKLESSETQRRMAEERAEEAEKRRKKNEEEQELVRRRVMILVDSLLVLSHGLSPSLSTQATPSIEPAKSETSLSVSPPFETWGPDLQHNFSFLRSHLHHLLFFPSLPSSPSSPTTTTTTTGASPLPVPPVSVFVDESLQARVDDELRQTISRLLRFSDLHDTTIVPESTSGHLLDRGHGHGREREREGDHPWVRDLSDDKAARAARTEELVKELERERARSKQLEEFVLIYKQQQTELCDIIESLRDIRPSKMSPSNRPEPRNDNSDEEENADHDLDHAGHVREQGPGQRQSREQGQSRVAGDKKEGGGAGSRRIMLEIEELQKDLVELSASTTHQLEMLETLLQRKDDAIVDLEKRNALLVLKLRQVEAEARRLLEEETTLRLKSSHQLQLSHLQLQNHEATIDRLQSQLARSFSPPPSSSSLSLSSYPSFSSSSFLNNPSSPSSLDPFQ